VPVGDRWHTGFVDATGTGGLLAQVQGRTSAAVLTWLNEQPAPWRAAITHVSIDLSASYAKAVREALPDAILVANRFHLVRLAHDMLTQLRQRLIRESYGRRGPKSRPCLGRPTPAADRPRAAARRSLRPDMELADQHR
jgi:transposase